MYTNKDGKMKKSTAYLLQNKRDDSNFFVKEISKRLPQAELIGSCVRNEYIDSKLSASVRKHSLELVMAFPRNNTEEKRLFNLLNAARYNPDFVVTKEDIDILVPKVELLRDIAKKICEERIKEYVHHVVLQQI